MIQSRRPRRRLARRYVAVTVALVAGSILAAGAINLRFSYLDRKKALTELQGEKAAAAAARISQFVDGLHRQVASATRPASPQERRDEFRRILFQAPAVTDLRYIDAGGVERVVVSRLQPDVIDGSVDRSHEEVFTNARPGQPYQGPVSFRDGTEPYLTVAHRIEGQDGGVVVADVHLALIHDVVSGIEVGRRGQAFVVDRDGVLVAHPDLTLVLSRRDLSSLPHVRDALARPAGNGIVARNQDGTRVLMSYRLAQPPGWPVFVQQPLDAAFDGIQDEIARTGALLAVAVLASGAAALVLARRMVNPLVALQRGAARIGAGALDQRIDVRSGDELEELAGEFNRMSARLQVSLADLQQVNEELRESRVRIVAAADDARRRLERDLHDGAQQHLTAMAMKLKLARRTVDDGATPVAVLLDELRGDIQTAMSEVRSLAHGIFPPLLQSGGLRVALPAAAKLAGTRTTVELDSVDRYPQEVEATVYFCCVEGLQNAVKHAGDDATVHVRVWDAGSSLRFSVTDDGIGFDSSDVTLTGHGFVNMTDRLRALGGTIEVTSSVGAGASVSGSVPLPPEVHPDPPAAC